MKLHYFILPFFFLGAGSALTATPNSNCQMEFDHFKETTQWQGQNGKVLIQADSACARKLGFPFQLTKVRVEVRKLNENSVFIESETALYSKKRGKLILEKPVGPFERGSFSAGEPIILDLEKGEVKSPSGKFIQLRSGT